MTGQLSPPARHLGDSLAPVHDRGRYRADIQGLRGIAVLLVVLYHAGLSFSGGFIGVDVFFVISGFVIVRGLHDELSATDHLDLTRFYTRRARRLLPAFAVTGLVSLTGSLLLLDSLGEQQQAVRTGVAASLFAANVSLFAGDYDYFGPGQEINPFLHTWSLSLEEQFYFVLPLLLAGLWRLDRRRPGGGSRMRTVLGALALVSFGASVALTVSEVSVGPGTSRTLAFYGMPLRWWEFSAGVLLALRPARSFRAPRALSAAAIVALLAAAFLYDDATVFPGLTAVVPVLATVILIGVAPAVPALERALSWRPLTLVGDVSYGWYLLHWPAIVFFPRLFPGLAYPAATAAVLSFGLSLVLSRFVEEPIRHRRGVTTRIAVALSGVCIAAPIAAGALVGVVVVTDRGAAPPPGRDGTGLPVARAQECIIESLSAVEAWSRERCLFHPDASNGAIVLLGDSHAASFSDAAVAAGEILDRPVAIWARASCPLVGRAAPGYSECVSWQADATELVDTLQPDVVIIANRSPAYVWPTTGSESPLGPIAQADGSASEDRAAALASWESGLEDTVRAFTDRGIAVVLLAVVPEFPPGSFVNATLLHPDPVPPTLTISDLAARRGEVLALEREALQGMPGVTVLDPAATLCDTVCHAARDGVWLYHDNQHLNRFGSSLLTAPTAEAVLAAVAGLP